MTWSFCATVVFAVYVSSYSSTTDPYNPNAVLVKVTPSWIFQSDLSTYPIIIIMTFHPYNDIQYINGVHLHNVICNCNIQTEILNATVNELRISLGTNHSASTTVDAYNFVLSYRTGGYVTTNITLTIEADPSVISVSPVLVFSTGGIKLTITGNGFNAGGNTSIEVSTSFNNIQRNITKKECYRPSNVILFCTLPKLSIDQIFKSNSIDPSSCMIGFQRDKSIIITCDNNHLSIEVNLLFQNRFLPLPIDQFFNVTLQKPNFDSSSVIQLYDPSKSPTLTIVGSNILLGCHKDDYSVRLGSESCSITEIDNNHVTFSPPRTKPNKVPNNPYCIGETLPLIVYLGDVNDSPASFFIKCLRYETSRSNVVGLGVGLGVGLFAFILLSVFVGLCIHYCFKVNKKTVKEAAWEHNNKVVQEFIEKSEKVKSIAAIPAILQMVSDLHEEELKMKYGIPKTSTKDEAKSYTEQDIVFIDEINPATTAKDAHQESHTEISNEVQASTSCEELNSIEEISQNLLCSADAAFGKMDRMQAVNT